MSLATWKKRFYKTPASKATKTNALAHSLLKWTGLTEANLRKHNLTKVFASIIDETTARELPINDKSCALCFVYLPKDALRTNETACYRCPLYAANNNHPCDSFETGRESPYGVWLSTEDPKLMIRLLRKATAMQAEKGKKKAES